VGKNSTFPNTRSPAHISHTVGACMASDYTWHTSDYRNTGAAVAVEDGDASGNRRLLVSTSLDSFVVSRGYERVPLASQ
jgi:hypothetical protein